MAQTELLHRLVLRTLGGVGVGGTEKWEPDTDPDYPNWASVQVRRRMTDAEIARIAPRAMARGWRPPAR